MMFDVTNLTNLYKPGFSHLCFYQAKSDPICFFADLFSPTVLFFATVHHHILSLIIFMKWTLYRNLLTDSFFC